MNDILDKWDTLISDALRPENGSSLNSSYLTNIADNVVQERNLLRKYLINQTFELQEDKQTEKLIQRTQALLISLLDKLNQYLQAPEGAAEIKSIYRLFGDQLQFLLSFIENDFRKYFNVDEKVPDSYLEISKGELINQYEPVKNILASRAELDKEFVSTLHKSMDRFCSDENEECTYRDLIYHKELIKELLTLGKLTKVDCMYSALKELLIYMDFNSPYFINYFLTQFRDLQTIEELASHQKEISLMHTKPGYRLYPDRPSVKQSLTDALQKEIDFLEVSKSDMSPHQIDSTPIHLSLTGKQLYIFIRAFVIAHGVSNETTTSLITKLAPYILNKSQKPFSAESLRKYIDKIGIEDKEYMKKLFTRMTKALDDM